MRRLQHTGPGLLRIEEIDQVFSGRCGVPHGHGQATEKCSWVKGPEVLPAKEFGIGNCQEAAVFRAVLESDQDVEGQILTSVKKDI